MADTEKRMDVSRKNKIIFPIGIVILYLVVLAPFLCTLIYSLPYSDDFTGLDNIGSSFFISAVQRAVEAWFKWDGELFSGIVKFFFNPLLYASAGSFRMGVTLLITFLIYIGGFSYFLIVCFTRLFEFKNKWLIAAVNILLIATFLFARNYDEIYYWYTGSSYLFGIVFTFLVLGLTIKYYYDDNTNIRTYILMVVAGIFACNGTTCCVTVGVSHCLFAFLNIKEHKRKISFKDVFPLIPYVMSGCFAVFAPGNFARYETRNTGELSGGRIVNAFISCVRDLIYRCQHLLESGPFVAMLAGIFIVGLVIGARKKESLGRLWLFLPIGMICTFGAGLPISIGQAGDSILLASRTCFLVDVRGIIAVELFLLWLGIFLAQKLNVSYEAKDYLILGLLCVCFLYVAVIKDQDYERCEWFNQVKHFSDVRAEHKMWAKIFDEINASDDEDVVITISEDDYVVSGVLQSPALNEDPKHWVNRETQRYFGKRSLSFVVTESREKL